MTRRLAEHGIYLKYAARGNLIVVELFSIKMRRRAHSIVTPRLFVVRRQIMGTQFFRVGLQNKKWVLKEGTQLFRVGTQNEKWVLKTDMFS